MRQFILLVATIIVSVVCGTAIFSAFETDFSTKVDVFNLVRALSISCGVAMIGTALIARRS